MDYSRRLKPWEHLYDMYGIGKDYTYVPHTCLDIFINYAKKNPDRECLIFDGTTFSAREVYVRAAKVANWLISTGINQGDNVGIILPNIPQMVMSILGTWMCGATAVLLNPLYTKRELEFQLESTKVKAIIVLENFYNKISSINVPTLSTGFYDEVSSLKSRITRILMHKHTTGTYEWKDIMKTLPLYVNQCKPEQIASIIFTGGTNGIPKGAMRSHLTITRTLAIQLQWYSNTIELKGDGIVEHRELTIAPFFHIYGLEHGFLYTLSEGLSCVLNPIPNVCDTADLIQQYNVGLIQLVPEMFQRMVDKKLCSKLSSVRFAVSAAGKVSQKLREEFLSLTGLDIVDCYGMTECAPISQGCYKRGLPSCKPGSSGIPTLGLDVSIRSIESPAVELPPNEYGEIAVRGAQLMEGYYHTDNAKGAYYDGWFLTGDCGFIDEEGWLYIAGRKKEMVSVNGFKVYAYEIESVLNMHPKVKEGVMVGKELPFGTCLDSVLTLSGMQNKTVGLPWEPGEVKNNEIVKVVVVKKDPSLTKEELIEYFRKNVAPYKVPKEVSFVDSLPRDALGKVKKNELRFV